MNVESQSSNTLDHRFYNPWSCHEGFLPRLPVLMVVQSICILKAHKKCVKTIFLTVLGQMTFSCISALGKV